MLLLRKLDVIDVAIDAHFSTATTAGDTSIWDAAYNDLDLMNVTLPDGFFFGKSVVCSKCSALNIVWDDENINEALPAFDNLCEVKMYDGDGDSDDDDGRLSSACTE
jgi:hypothetical protein